MCNCGGPHTANYRGYLEFQKLRRPQQKAVDRIREKTTSFSNPPPPPQLVNQPAQQAQLRQTSSSAVRGQTGVHPPDQMTLLLALSINWSNWQNDYWHSKVRFLHCLLTSRHGQQSNPNVVERIMASLHVVLWNANGLLSGKLELEVFLQQERVDIALITETHCTANYSFISTQHYHVLHAFHPTGKAQGGAAIFIKKSLVFSPDITVATMQFQLYSVNIFVDNRVLTLASLYCSPSCTTDSVAFDLLFQQLKGTWLVGGDFNAKHRSWGSRITTTRGRALSTVL